MDMEGGRKVRTQQQCSFKVMFCNLMSFGQEKAQRVTDQLFTLYLDQSAVHLKPEEQIYTTED